MEKNKLDILRAKVFQPKASGARIENIRKKHYRFLIVCEGEKTEPNYFKALARDEKYTAVIDVDVKGLGRSTTSLVKEAQKIKRNLEKCNSLPFDRTWVVFDEDDNKDFNKAINDATANDLKVAWSNEAFELWYLLHFIFLDTAITRKAYIEKLNNILRKKLETARYSYKKNDPKFYSLLQNYGDEALAKRRAEKLRSCYSGNNYKKQKPCTTVDLLVEEIEHPEIYIDEE